MGEKLYEDLVLDVWGKMFGWKESGGGLFVCEVRRGLGIALDI